MPVAARHPAAAHRREIPRKRNENKRTRTTPHTRPRTRASPLARGGSPPRNPPRKKREQAYTLCGGPRGEPPYRRLRSESDTIVIASEAWQSRGNELPQILARAGSAPRGGSPPAEVPCRKKRFARFCRENRFSIYVIAFLRREPLISVSCGYTYSAFTAACFHDRSRFLSFPKPFTSVPATAENRVVFYKTKKIG